MQNKIDRLRNHFVVCGAGNTGKYVIDELCKTGQVFVVIERDPAIVAELVLQGILCVEGDATHGAVLRQAGVEHARGLITCLDTDAVNLYVTLTARQAHPTLRVIAKGVEEEAEAKLRLAGADGVVMPQRIGGLRMASELTRPAVVTFLDVMLRNQDATLRVEDIVIDAHSPLAGRTLEQSGLCDLEGATVVAMRDQSDNQYCYNPRKTTLLTPGSIIIVMGDVAVIDAMRQRAGMTMATR